MVDRNATRYHRGGTFRTREGMQLQIPLSGFDWRAIVGGIPGVVDPYGENAAQQFPLGTKLVNGEETFRYCLMGATAGVVSSLYQAVVPLAGHINEAIDVPAVGDTGIAFTPNTATTDDLALNELQDGYIFIYDNTGEGHKYRILSHPIIVGGASGELTLVDPIRVAPIAASVATVMHNRYSKIIVHPSPPTAIPVGWPQQAITADFYFWLLTAGPTALLIDGTVKMGQLARPSEDDDGAVAAMLYNESTGGTEGDFGTVARVMEIGADAAGNQATFGFGIALLD